EGGWPRAYTCGRRHRSSQRSSHPASRSRNLSIQARCGQRRRSSSKDCEQSWTNTAAATSANAGLSISWLASRFHLKLHRSRLLEPTETESSHTVIFPCSTRG